MPEVSSKGEESTYVSAVRLNKFLVDGRPLVELSDTSIGADYVILCLGVSPESGLARDCGLETGERGGILVDEHLRTTDRNIYAGGDCVEIANPITGGRAYFPLGSLANRHGRVIAENIAGNPARFTGAVGAALVKVCTINMGCVGLSEAQATAAGIACEDSTSLIIILNQEIVLKMIYGPDDGRLFQAAVPRYLQEDRCFSSMLRVVRV